MPLTKRRPESNKQIQTTIIEWLLCYDGRCFWNRWWKQKTQNFDSGTFEVSEIVHSLTIFIKCGFRVFLQMMVIQNKKYYKICTPSKWLWKRAQRCKTFFTPKKNNFWDDKNLVSGHEFFAVGGTVFGTPA